MKRISLSFQQKIPNYVLCVLVIVLLGNYLTLALDTRCKGKLLMYYNITDELICKIIH